MQKIQIARPISSDLCIRLTWNLTGSCGQQQRLRGWSRIVAKQFQDGGRPPFWKWIYRHISVKKSSHFQEILYTATDFELDERHVIKKWESCIGQTSSWTERISCFYRTLNDLNWWSRLSYITQLLQSTSQYPILFLSASLYVSKRGAYWDRLCRDVVGWLVGCHARALWPNGAS